MGGKFDLHLFLGYLLSGKVVHRLGVFYKVVGYKLIEVLMRSYYIQEKRTHK